MVELCRAVCPHKDFSRQIARSAGHQFVTYIADVRLPDEGKESETDICRLS
jgi:hypothetical protein